MTKRKEPIRTLTESGTATLQAQIALVRRAQRQTAKVQDTDPLVLKALSDQVAAIGRAIASVAAEARKQAESDEAAAVEMTPSQRVDMILEWLPVCPIEDRVRLSARLIELDTRL